jgi:hypothetical protein
MFYREQVQQAISKAYREYTLDDYRANKLTREFEETLRNVLRAKRAQELTAIDALQLIDDVISAFTKEREVI